jgi:hypothetical protein
MFRIKYPELRIAQPYTISINSISFNLSVSFVLHFVVLMWQDTPWRLSSASSHF